MDSFDGFDRESISDVDCLPLFIRFVAFSSSIDEVLNPNYSNSLNFSEQEKFSPTSTDFKAYDGGRLQCNSYYVIKWWEWETMGINVSLE